MEKINKIIASIKNNKMHPIDVGNWKKFKIGEIFEVSIANSIDKSKLSIVENGKINYVSRKSTNNGVDGTLNDINKKFLIKKNVLTMAMVGYKGTCFWQDKDFIASQNILLLRNNKLNANIALFLRPCFEHKFLGENTTYKALKKEIIINETIKLPSKNNEPDWEYMDNFIADLQRQMGLER
jgi:hypothetical protein